MVRAKDRERILAAYRESGLTQSEFAKTHKLNVGTLRGWIYRPPKRSLEEAEGNSARFIEVKAERNVGRPLILRVGPGIELELEELPPPEYLAALARAAC